MIKEQFGWLKGFSEEVKAGALSEAQIQARSGMYINSAREAYEKANAKVAGKWGADTVDWLLGIVATEHCGTCEDRAAMGPQPIGPKGGFPSPDGEVFPGDGNSECLTKCGCSLGFSNSVTGEEFWGEP